MVGSLLVSKIFNDRPVEERDFLLRR